MEYYSGVRFNNFIIYSKELTEDNLELLQSNEKQAISATNSGSDYIAFDGKQYIIYEWVEYFIVGFNDNRLVSEDFVNIGEYYKNNSGSLFLKNFVGYIKFRNQKFQVVSHKISIDELHSLIETIDDRINETISLSFSENGVSSATFEKKRDRHKDFYIYMKLYNSLKKRKILPNLKIILKFPNKKFESTCNLLPLSLANNISNESLMDIFSGRTNLTKRITGRNITKFNDFIPEEINEYYNKVSHDTSENRFIKFFIKQCIRILLKFHDELVQYTPQNQLLIKDVNHYREELVRLYRSNFFSSISDITSINHSSTILTRQIGYKQIYEEYVNLKQVPINNLFDSKDLMELYNNKSIDKLYEFICLFRLIDLLEKIYQTPALSRIKVDTLSIPYTVGLSESNDGLEFKFRATKEFPEVILLFQHSFTQSNSGSFSVEFKPDFTLKIFDNNHRDFFYCHFDSKFKISNDGSSKNEDIVKMHAYCDGIHKTIGAYVLFPGETRTIYTNSSVKIKGVGAFPLSFNQDNDRILENFLKEILSRR